MHGAFRASPSRPAGRTGSPGPRHAKQRSSQSQTRNQQHGLHSECFHLIGLGGLGDVTYLFALGPALGGSGGAGLVGGAVGVASGSHDKGGGPGDAGERGSGDTEERHGYRCRDVRMVEVRSGAGLGRQRVYEMWPVMRASKRSSPTREP